MVITATIPNLPEESDKVPLDLLVGLLAMDWDHTLGKPARVSPKDAFTELNSVIKSIKEFKKQKDSGIHEIQLLARRTWQANAATEKRLKQIENEKKNLERKREQLWKQFDKVLLPLWGFDEKLIPIHETLVAIIKKLEDLVNHANPSLSTTDKTKILRESQHELHELEQDFIDGKFMKDQSVPKGQAMCVSLMNRAYRLASLLASEEPDVDPSLFETFVKLNDIVAHLACILDLAEDGWDVEPLEVQLYQEQLHDIEAKMKDGKFIDEQGNIPQGQAMLHDKLEQAYDMIHYCIVLIESNDEEKNSGAIKTLVETRDKLWNAAVSFPSKLSNATYNLLVEPLSSAVSTVKGAAQKSTALSRMYVQSALGYAQKVTAELEEVDPLLAPLQDQLKGILVKLKGLRDERNKLWLDSAVLGGSLPVGYFKKYDKLLDGVYEELKEIEGNRKNGKFTVDSKQPENGQRYIESLYNQCFSLCLEMMDENSI